SQLHMAMQMISDSGAGVLVYLPQEGRGIGLVEKIRAYELQEKGLDTVEAHKAHGYKADMRDYGLGIQIIKDQGQTNIRLLTNNTKKTDAFISGGFVLKGVEQVSIIPTPKPHSARYLTTMPAKVGHDPPENV